MNSKRHRIEADAGRKHVREKTPPRSQLHICHSVVRMLARIFCTASSSFLPTPRSPMAYFSFSPETPEVAPFQVWPLRMLRNRFCVRRSACAWDLRTAPQQLHVGPACARGRCVCRVPRYLASSRELLRLVQLEFHGPARPARLAQRALQFYSRQKTTLTAVWELHDLGFRFFGSFFSGLFSALSL